MSIKELTIGAPFFDLKVLQDESYRNHSGGNINQ